MRTLGFALYVFLYLCCVHSVSPDGLCTPCSRLAASGRGIVRRRDWAAALFAGCALAPTAGRVRRNRSKSSTRPRHSPELDARKTLYRFSFVVANNLTLTQDMPELIVPPRGDASGPRRRRGLADSPADCLITVPPVKLCNGVKYSRNN